MNRDEAVKLLMGGLKGITEWNQRREKKEGIPDLDKVELRGAVLSKAFFFKANLTGANLTEADLTGANLVGLELSNANLTRANLHGAFLTNAFLTAANLTGANLTGANLTGANLYGADLTAAICMKTEFGNVDLSHVTGLDSVTQSGPCTIGTDTLFRSRGKIPEAFLRGCGLPDALIRYLPSLMGSMSPIQFYSCFISYSTKDEDFAKRLHSRMRDEGLRVWFAPEDMQAGRKMHEQVDEAIRLFDKVLLVLSPNSINSRWVRDEIRRTRKSEIREARKKLFPIRLMDYKALGQWESFYADFAEDVAEEIREYFIPDFSNWKDHDSFEAGFSRVLKDLKAEESNSAKPT